MSSNLSRWLNILGIFQILLPKSIEIYVDKKGENVFQKFNIYVNKLLRVLGTRMNMLLRDVDPLKKLSSHKLSYNPY